MSFGTQLIADIGVFLNTAEFAVSATYYEGPTDVTGTAVTIVLEEFESNDYGDEGQEFNRTGLIVLADDGTVTPTVRDRVLVGSDTWNVLTPPKQQDGMISLSVGLPVTVSKHGGGFRRNRY